MSVVVSFLHLFVVLIALLDNGVLAKFSFRPANSTCVWTDRQLRKVIEKASNKIRTRITLCRQLISISDTRNQYDSTGIDLTDRIIDLRCYLKRSKGTCSLDGRSLSRIFYGERADLTVRNVLFTNAIDNYCFNGGAISLDYTNITLTGCSFMYNGGECVSGGALYVFQSTLKINGGTKNRPVMFSENKGFTGGALYVEKSEVSIDGYTVFSNNFVDYGGAVEIDSSIFNIKNVKFQENFGASGSAIYSYEASSTMRNVDFIGNVGISVNRYYNSSLLATNCTFANNNGTVIKAELSKITLKNSTFSNNTSNENASNIYIDDDDDPLFIGTFVKCESNVVFCNGLGDDSIDEDSIDNTIGDFSNTDCNSKGLQGTPGQGSCPI